MSLSDAKLRSAKGQTKDYKLYDNEGLFVIVKPSGSILWRFRYRFQGKEGNLALGTYPATGLKEARERRNEARTQLEQGIDPGAEKKRHAVAAAMHAANTFKLVAEEYIEKAKADGMAPATEVKTYWLLKQLEPKLGNRPIADIEPFEVLSVLRAVERRGNIETAHRLRSFASRVSADNIGELHDITVSDLYVHDVNGTNAAKETGGIAFRTLGARTPSRFIGLHIQRNILWKVDRTAIVGQSDQRARSTWFPSLGVVIKDNYAEDVGGDGIVPWATDGALVEHNIVRHAVQRAPGYNAGIWPWSTDNTVVQLNEAAFTKGTLDGEGFDSDYNSRNTAIYFNYSHDNEGGFLLLCTPVARRDEENLGNNGTVVRMNISRHDKTRTFHLAGASNSLIERNAIYIAKGDDVQAILVTDWDGWSDGAVFRGNRFVAEGTARYGHQIKRDEGVYEIGAGWGPATHFEFDRNEYSGTHIDPPADYATEDQPTIKSDTDWTGPAFDPSRPEGFGAYLAAHRQWMLDLMAKEFGRMPQLLNPAPTGDPLARRKP